MSQSLPASVAWCQDSHNQVKVRSNLVPTIQSPPPNLKYKSRTEYTSSRPTLSRLKVLAAPEPLKIEHLMHLFKIVAHLTLSQDVCARGLGIIPPGEVGDLEPAEAQA